MIVGKINVDKRELERHVSSAKDFMDYCDSLVPSYFKHQQGIIDNQRYMCCLYLRDIATVSWDVKKVILNDVMAKISVIGYSNSLIEADTLFSVANMKRIEKMAIKEGVIEK